LNLKAPLPGGAFVVAQLDIAALAAGADAAAEFLVESCQRSVDSRQRELAAESDDR
jgi:hypothetical protein